MSPSRTIAWIVFATGLLALAAAWWARDQLRQTAVSSVQLEVGLRSGLPSLGCLVRGTNPFPVSVEVPRLQLAIGGKSTPLSLHVAPQVPLYLDAGAFEAHVPVLGADVTTLLSSGEGFGTGVLDGLDYDGVMDVTWGPWTHTVRFRGVVEVF